MATLYCQNCGYNLSNLPENRCPECGEGFDPRELEGLLRGAISTRSVVLQLIFVPALIAVLSPLLLCGAIALDPVNSDAFTITVMVLIFLAGTVAHTYPLARKFIQAKKLRDGTDSVAWIFRKVWPCCILFTLVEGALAFGYFAGGCAVIIMNMSFH